MDARANSAGYLYLVPFRYCPSGKTHRPECGELVFLRLLAEIRLGATVIVHLERVHDFIGPLVERQIGFRVIYIAQLRVRLGRARHKQRAAVGRILTRNLERAELFGVFDNLELVAADKRTEDLHLHRIARRGKVIERLRRNLTQAFAVTSAFAPSRRAMRSATRIMKRR